MERKSAEEDKFSYDSLAIAWGIVKKHGCDDVDSVIDREKLSSILGEFSRELYRLMNAAQSEPKWVPCSERLPEFGVRVIVACRYEDGSYSIRTGFINTHIKWWANINTQLSGVTHWQPLPQFHNQNQNER